MPPKADIKMLGGKRDNAIGALYDLFEEFEAVFAVQPQPKRLEAVFNQLETKYRSIKKQEVIADRLVEEDTGADTGSASANQKAMDKVKVDYLEICCLSKGSQSSKIPRKLWRIGGDGQCSEKHGRNNEFKAKH